MKRDQEVGPGQREEWEKFVMAHTLHQGEKSHVGDDGNRRGLDITLHLIRLLRYS